MPADCTALGPWGRLPLPGWSQHLLTTEDHKHATVGQEELRPLPPRVAALSEAVQQGCGLWVCLPLVQAEWHGSITLCGSGWQVSQFPT